MLRTTLAVAFLASCSCATVKAPPAQDLAGLLAGILADPAAVPAGPTECPPWIKIEGEITDESSALFVKTLALCQDRTVAVEINSPGGNWMASLEMQKAIERHPHTVVCMADGMAASAAFLTLESCDLRTMTSRTVLMAHQAALGGQGHERELQNAAEAAKALDRALAIHCAQAMNMTVEEFEAHVADGREWWMDVDDAHKYHAVDLEVSGITDVLELLHAKGN